MLVKELLGSCNVLLAFGRCLCHLILNGYGNTVVQDRRLPLWEQLQVWSLPPEHLLKFGHQESNELEISTKQKNLICSQHL